MYVHVHFAYVQYNRSSCGCVVSYSVLSLYIHATLPHVVTEHPRTKENGQYLTYTLLFQILLLSRQVPYKMCLIRFRPDREADVIVPNRPIRVELPPSQHGQTASAAHGQKPFGNKEGSTERARTQHHAVVIEQIAPETSKIEIRQGSSSPSPSPHGVGPVPTTPKSGPLHQRNDSQKDPMRPAQVRRSGSLAHAKNPRQSTASYRSTRERVVVVDDSGRRREYYRRDDSGR